VRAADAARVGGAGAAAGTAATVAMSALMLAAGRAGFGEYPPERVARQGLRRDGHGHLRAEALDGPLGAVLHVAFGAALGAAFATTIPSLTRRVRGRLRATERTPAPALLTAAGVAFGSMVWLVSYWGWMPSLGILPPPDRDRADRQVTMLAAHWVFGAVLGATVAALVPGATDADSESPTA
jgi:hypothetical protein